MNKESTFKKKFKPCCCTQNPIKYTIPYKQRYDTLRTIKQECLEIYGEDVASECKKRLTCLTKNCTGRQLFWDSKTALPYLNKLIRLGLINSDGDLYVEGCNNCPIKNICTYPCFQINDFIKRHYNKEPWIIYKESVENYEHKYDRPETIRPQEESLTVPWDCLTSKQALIVRKYLFENKDFERVAKDVGLFNQAEVKYYFYSALNILSEVAIMRKFFRFNYKQLTITQRKILKLVYFKNKTFVAAAQELGISKQSVQQTIKRVIKKYSIKTQKFVWKNGNKIRYNISKLFK